MIQNIRKNRNTKKYTRKYLPWYIFYILIYLYPEKYLPACMELVLNAPFHLDSLGRPVLDVTRTVNHLGGHHDYMMTSWLYDDIMLKWDHDHMMTSCWDDIMIIGYHIQGTFLCIHTTCDDHEKNDIMMRWYDDTHCKVVAIPTGSQRVPLPVESSRCEIGNDYVNDWHVQTVLWLLIWLNTLVTI